MRSLPLVFISYCTLALTVLLYMSKPTDADLLDQETVSSNTYTAVTLDLNNLDTANQTQKSVLFSVQGLVPGGFAVESVRFKNTGSQTMTYSLVFQQTAGDAEACSALQVKALRNWSILQDTALTGLAIGGDLSTDQTEDYVLAVSLDSTTSTLQSKSCLFNLSVSARAKDANGSVQFTDEEILQNQIGIGNWSAQ